MDVKIIECPRDAMQGLPEFIPTSLKISYINSLLKVGFDTVDFGSFVSPKAIPQLADTAEVLASLDLDSTRSKLLAIVANLKGAQQACSHPEIRYIGYPFSVSETFQKRNTNSGISDSLNTIGEIQNLCVGTGKELVAYLSMGFGNPYGDPWNVEVVEKWTNELAQMGIRILSLSDTVGVATPDSISYLFKSLIPKYPNIEFGAHLHTTPDTWEEKVAAAWGSGCKRFDGAIKGFGGCPMAADALTGNMPTENLLLYFGAQKVQTGIEKEAFEDAMLEASKVFH